MNQTAVHLQFFSHPGPLVPIRRLRRDREFLKDHQSGGPVFKLRQLYLYLTLHFVTAWDAKISRITMVPSITLVSRGIFQVAQLCRGKFIVTNHPWRPAQRRAPDLFYFSFPQIGSRMNPPLFWTILSTVTPPAVSASPSSSSRDCLIILVGGVDRNQNHRAPPAL